MFSVSVQKRELTGILLMQFQKSEKFVIQLITNNLLLLLVMSNTIAWSPDHLE